MNPPSVWFRLTPEVRQRAKELAHRRGITVSSVAREALGGGAADRSRRTLRGPSLL